MGTTISIDPRTGSVDIGTKIRLKPFQSKAEIEPQIMDLVHSIRDHGNGYDWLYLQGLTFGEHPASIALCFHEKRLEAVEWSVRLPNAPLEGGWPTREAIDQEIVFVRNTLAKNGVRLRDGEKRFSWGKMWSDFDPKGFLASNGLRYRSM